MMFALLMIPLVAAAGAAVDLYRVHDAKTWLSEAADAAILSAARAKMVNPDLTNAAAKTIARKMFDANIKNAADVSITGFEFVADPDGETFRVEAAASVPMTLLRVVGIVTMPVDVLSEARMGEPRALEVVLVLDNTGSMNGQKMTDLKSAAGELIDKIMTDADNETLVGVVPFARHVNVGVSRAAEPWLQVFADGTWDENVCTVDETAAANAGCSQSPSTCYWDGVPYSCSAWTCPSGDLPTNCAITTHVTSWYGCVGSRNHPLNVEDRDYLSSRIPTVNNAGGPDCPREITPMTTNKTQIEAAIAAMTVGGETYIPGGLFWGQALISSEEPFTEGRSYADIASEGGIKAIVLMTDGENTASPDDWTAHYDSNTSEANGYTEELCDEIKSDDIQLYTIAFDVSEPSVQTLLRDCATEPSFFYDAGDSAELSSAFEAIANNLVELALTK